MLCFNSQFLPPVHFWQSDFLQLSPPVHIPQALLQHDWSTLQFPDWHASPEVLLQETSNSRKELAITVSILIFFPYFYSQFSPKWSCMLLLMVLIQSHILYVCPWCILMTFIALVYFRIRLTGHFLWDHLEMHHVVAWRSLMAHWTIFWFIWRVPEFWNIPFDSRMTLNTIFAK